ncbi:MAG: circularly permuted type 2 ATP-grasp protein [Planctomycetaceae bacterium]
MLNRLEQMGVQQLTKRWQQAQVQIDRDGVTYNPHDDDGLVSRPWLLDAIPMILSEAEWSPLAGQLSQRARVLEALLTDLFGEQRLLKDRIIPPELLYGHPAWYPSYQNLNKPGQRYLTYCVTDLARSPDGSWWATGDRTRSPFGLGYVLENRIVTSRMLSPIFRNLRIRRLAEFYAALKEHLRSLAPRFKDNPRIVLWTKGPQSRGYFEDSYLARYLGYTLAEGDDLAVRGNQVQLLTLGGILPVEVLLRRIDDEDCDSVELNGASTIGISALLDVLRDDRVAVANCLGSRLVESPAFLPFLPAVSRHLLQEELQIPTVATWWCGDRTACHHVLSNLSRLLIRPAFRMSDERPIVGRQLSEKQKSELAARIQANPSGFVGQEIVQRSTTPVLTESGVAPWHVGLRTFMTAVGSGFHVMPGGLARVSPDSDSLNFTMTDGERSQDVWILSDKPVDNVSLLDATSAVVVPRRSGAELPSRVANNFFWLGRYAERASQTARLLRTLFLSLESEDINGPKNTPMLRVLAQQGQVEPDHLVPELSRTITDIMLALPAGVLDASRPMSLQSSVNSTVRTAMGVRDRISRDMWRVVDSLHSQFVQAAKADDPRSVDMMVLVENTLSDLSGLFGLVAEGMTRTLAWNFFDLGCRLERCSQTSALLRSFLVDQISDDPESLETLLTATDSLITYRNRYLATFQIPVVLDLLMTDASNPRSVIYQIELINQHLQIMPGNAGQALMSAEQKLGVMLSNSIRLMDIFSCSRVDGGKRRPRLAGLLDRLDDRLPKLSNALTSRFLIHAGLPRHFGSSAEGALAKYPSEEPS